MGDLLGQHPAWNTRRACPSEFSSAERCRVKSISPRRKKCNNFDWNSAFISKEQSLKVTDERGAPVARPGCACACRMGVRLRFRHSGFDEHVAIVDRSSTRKSNDPGEFVEVNPLPAVVFSTDDRCVCLVETWLSKRNSSMAIWKCPRLVFVCFMYNTDGRFVLPTPFSSLSFVSRTKCVSRIFSSSSLCTLNVMTTLAGQDFSLPVVVLSRLANRHGLFAPPSRHPQTGELIFVSLFRCRSVRWFFSFGFCCCAHTCLDASVAVRLWPRQRASAD